MTLTTWATPCSRAEFGPALAGKDAAKPPAEKGGDLDHPLFPLDLFLQKKPDRAA